MSQLLYLSIPEINMLVQSLVARVTVLEGCMRSSSTPSYTIHGPTSTVPSIPGLFGEASQAKPTSAAVPIVDPALMRKCGCGRIFAHKTHLLCNRCAKEKAKEIAKTKPRPVLPSTVPAADGTVVSKPSSAPVRPAEGGGKTDSAPPSTRKRKVRKTTTLSISVKQSSGTPTPKPQASRSRESSLVGNHSEADAVDGFLNCVSPPPDMKPKPRLVPGYQVAPQRFETKPEDQTEFATLMREWHEMSDREAELCHAVIAYRNIAKIDTVLNSASSKRVPPYSIPPGAGTEQALKYLRQHPDVQPWILRNAPTRQDFEVPELRWQRPDWIGHRKPPAKRQAEKERRERSGVDRRPALVPPPDFREQETATEVVVPQAASPSSRRINDPFSMMNGLSVLHPMKIRDSDDVSDQAVAWHQFLASFSSEFHYGGFDHGRSDYSKRGPEITEHHYRAVAAADTLRGVLIEWGWLTAVGNRTAETPAYLKKAELKVIFQQAQTLQKHI